MFSPVYNVTLPVLLHSITYMFFTVQVDLSVLLCTGNIRVSSVQHDLPVLLCTGKPTGSSLYSTCNPRYRITYLLSSVNDSASVL
jgi:hypothetical protein